MPKTALEQWDETAANNTDMGGIDLSENVMRPPAVNNEMREHMAQVAKWLGDDTLASASTTDLGSVPGRYVTITGTTTITAFGTIKAGTVKYVKFAGILTLTHNGTSLILPGAANITTAAGDTAIFVSEGSGNWRCLGYFPAAPVPNTLNGQYKFPSTQNAATDANTLDDYEEGSTAPLAFPTSGAWSNADTRLSYVKIGKWVYVNGYLNIISNGTGAASISFTLPFSNAGDLSPFSAAKGGVGVIQAFLPASSSLLTLGLLDGSYAGGTGAILYFSGFYRTAS